MKKKEAGGRLHDDFSIEPKMMFEEMQMNTKKRGGGQIPSKNHPLDQPLNKHGIKDHHLERDGSAEDNNRTLQAVESSSRSDQTP